MIELMIHCLCLSLVQRCIHLIHRSPRRRHILPTCLEVRVQAHRKRLALDTDINHFALDTRQHPRLSQSLGHVVDLFRQHLARTRNAEQRSLFVVVDVDKGLLYEWNIVLRCHRFVQRAGETVDGNFEVLNRTHGCVAEGLFTLHQNILRYQEVSSRKVCVSRSAYEHAVRFDVIQRHSCGIEERFQSTDLVQPVEYRSGSVQDKSSRTYTSAYASSELI